MIIYLALAVTLLNAFIVLYYWGLVLLSRFGTRRELADSAAGSKRFAILIPAHNEELTLPSTLRSCQELDYPRTRYDIIVIADNCTDNTARIGREAGATVLERHDVKARGKGQALAWAFERVLHEGYDAFLILDADCRIDRQALNEASRAIVFGALAIQFRYAVSNPDASVISLTTAVGNLIENDLFYAAKARLGLAVLLRGTGMVLTRELLVAHPWKAFSNTEDAEYSLELLSRGERIAFIQTASVWSDFPENARQLKIQRERWSSGNVAAVKRVGIGMLLRGLWTRQVHLADAGWTTLVLSRPLVIFSCVAGAVLSAWGAVVVPGPLSVAVLAAAMMVLMALVAYFALGVARLGLSLHRCRLLVRSPGVVMQLFLATVVGLLRSNPKVWMRSPRIGELSS